MLQNLLFFFYLQGHFLKNRGHILCMKVKKWMLLSRVWLLVTPWTLHPWNSPGQNIGVGSPSLLQGIFPTQGSNRGLLHCRQIVYQLSHKGSSRILEWVAYPFSSGSSRPRNWTGVSCIADGFLTNWAIREALIQLSSNLLQHFLTYCKIFILI